MLPRLDLWRILDRGAFSLLLGPWIDKLGMIVVLPESVEDVPVVGEEKTGPEDPAREEETGGSRGGLEEREQDGDGDVVVVEAGAGGPDAILAGGAGVGGVVPALVEGGRGFPGSCFLGLAPTSDVTKTFLPRNDFPCMFSISNKQSSEPSFSIEIFPDFHVSLYQY